MDRDFRPQPEMVGSWQISDDKLTYTFHLRDGLKFHDGQPVRAADAVASLKQWGQRNDSYGQPLLAAASAIEAIDDSQFRIVLKSRFPVLEALGTTTSPTPFTLPERLAKTDAFTQVTEVDGSGPFKFLKEEWQSGHKAVYVKNPDYVPRAEPPNNTAGGKVAKVDRVEWLYIATYDMLNPATNRNLRAPASGYSIPGWATDETIEDLRKAWFAAENEAQRRDLADKIQRRAFEIALYLPIGQLVGHRAFRNSLNGIPDSPIPVLWNIDKK
jgi:ABC-type transport system substrate-binding protein